MSSRINESFAQFDYLKISIFNFYLMIGELMYIASQKKNRIGIIKGREHTKIERDGHRKKT